MQAYSESKFDYLDRYELDGRFFWGVETEVLSSLLWREIIAGNDIDLNFHCSSDERTLRHVAYVSKGILALTVAPLVDEDSYMDIWHYRYYEERPYFANLFVLPAEQLESWQGKYMVHLNSIYWKRAMFPSRFFINGPTLVGILESTGDVGTPKLVCIGTVRVVSPVLLL